MQQQIINQDRDEGLYGDEYEQYLADIRGLIWGAKRSFESIARMANPPLHPHTVSQIAYGVTARPHDRTIKAILSALDFRRVIVPNTVTVLAEVKPDPVWPEDMTLARRERQRLARKARRTRKARGRDKKKPYRVRSKKN